MIELSEKLVASDANNKLNEALKYYEKSVAELKKLLTENAGNKQYQSWLGEKYNSVGNVLMKQKKVESQSVNVMKS